MAIKSFNVDKEVYSEFSEYCKNHGISMSRQINMFMKSQIGEPKVRKEYLEKLDRIRKGRFIRIEGSLMDNY